jgi:hypothetical protein
MQRIILRDLASFACAFLVLTAFSTCSHADENSTEFRSRAISNGEYLLVQQASANSGSDSSASQPGAAGGASMADFSMLMNLIQTTVDPDAWENGDATMQAYPGGIMLDTDGVVRRCKINPSLNQPLTKPFLGDDNSFDAGTGPSDAGWTKHATRRVVSVKRLLRAVDDYAKRGLQWDRELATLGGLHRIDFVVLDKSNDDLLLIGPAGGEVSLQNGTWVHSATGTSPVLLQDVLTLCDAFADRASPTVLCSLDPTADGIARVHALLSKPDAASRLVRNPAKGAEELARTMGMHQVSIAGLEPASPTALALLEADIHMKRLGLGLESAGEQLTSYPDWSEKLGLQPSGQLLRWWFTPDYPEIQCNEEQTIFAIPTRRVRLESERQTMDAAGNRNAAGAVDEAADKFAQQFTANFSAIQKKYPLYGRLSHVFDIAVAFKLAVEHSDWQASVSPDSNAMGQVPKEVAPTTATGTWKKGTQSHKWIVVSGGVELDLNRLNLDQRLTSKDNALDSSPVGQSQPEHDALTYWWWNETTTKNQ